MIRSDLSVHLVDESLIASDVKFLVDSECECELFKVVLATSKVDQQAAFITGHVILVALKVFNVIVIDTMILHYCH